MQSQPATDMPAPPEHGLPISPETLLARLTELGIDYTLHHHDAVFTVAEAERVEKDIPGTHCRNLFLRDKRKRNFLIVLRNETPVDLKKLEPLIGAERCSFGSPERLFELLGVRPGSVCPFAIVNDCAQAVTIILERAMMDADIVNYHPLLNTMTVGLSPPGLLKFIESTGHAAHILDMAHAAPGKEE